MQLVRDAAYHVLPRGHNREAVFADAEDSRYFLALLDRYRQRLDFRLYHYCLITNHFHLLLQLDNPRRHSALMAGFLVAYTLHCNPTETAHPPLQTFCSPSGRWGQMRPVSPRSAGPGTFNNPSLAKQDGQFFSTCGRIIQEGRSLF